MRAISKYLVSNLIYVALIVGPSGVAVILLGFIGGRMGLNESILSNLIIWLMGGVLIVGMIISSIFVAPPLAFKQCLKNEGIV